jgi:hypothetical protein
MTGRLLARCVASLDAVHVGVKLDLQGIIVLHSNMTHGTMEQVLLYYKHIYKTS